MNDLDSFLKRIKFNPQRYTVSDFKEVADKYGVALTDHAEALVVRERELKVKEQSYRIMLQRLEQRNKELESLNSYFKKSLVEALNKKAVEESILPKANNLGDAVVKMEEMLTVMRRVDTYLEKLSRNADLEYEMLTALRSTLGTK